MDGLSPIMTFVQLNDCGFSLESVGLEISVRSIAAGHWQNL